MSPLRTTAGGLLAAAVASTLTLAAPAPSAHAVDWTDPHVLVADNSGFGEVRVVSTNTTGGAVAAWIDGDTLSDRVRTSSATDSEWDAPTYLSAPGVDTRYLVLDANDDGDVAAAWLEQEGDTWRAMAARRIDGVWGPATAMSGVLPVDDAYPALAVAGDGTVFVAFPAVVAGKSTLQLRTWRPGQAPASAQVADEFATTPTLDAGENGDAVLTFALDQVTDSVYAMQYRHDTQKWDVPEQVSFIGTSSYLPTAAIGPTGRSTLAFTAKLDGVWRIQVVSENQQGTAWGLPVTVSSSALDGYWPSLAVDASGRALMAWQTVKNGTVGAAFSQRPGPDSGWPSQTALAVPTANLFPEVDVSDTGAQLIDLVSGDRRYTLLRTRPTEPFALRDWGDGYGKGTVQATTDADLGNAGHGLLISKFRPTVGDDEVQVRFLDVTGPATTLDALPANTVAASRKLTWTTTDDLSPVAGTDLSARTSAWNQKGFTKSEIADGAASPFVHQATPGTTYCFSGISSDAAGNVGPQSGERCTTFPLDDPSLKGTGWQRLHGKGAHYLGTVSRTTEHGRLLVRKGVRAKRLALVVAKSATGGKVRVTFGKSDLGTYSLHGTGSRKVIKLASFPTVRAGTVRIRVVSPTGRVVQVDGLVVAK